jgi:sulfite exporter TauE/SafE
MYTVLTLMTLLLSIVAMACGVWSFSNGAALFSSFAKGTCYTMLFIVVFYLFIQFVVHAPPVLVVSPPGC